MNTKRVAIVGAGMAGAACARTLLDAGCEVTVFDKSRGVGGRMATRRASWSADGVSAQTSHFDHGAPGFEAASPAFRAMLETLQKPNENTSGTATTWRPRLRLQHQAAEGTQAQSEAQTLWVTQPDMPALCRHLLRGAQIATEHTVTALQAHAHGWQLQVAEAASSALFDAVIVAIPPPQAAPLIAPHEPGWASTIGGHAMSPCWTLMAVTSDPMDPPGNAPGWDLMRPAQPPLSLIIRQDAKPGRPRLKGHALWVAHAQAAWSQAHLEGEPDRVKVLLQQALEAAVGSPLRWQHAVVHRWRYAQAAQANPEPGSLGPAIDPCLWSPQQRLGLCGDHFGPAHRLSRSGVEAAWLSGTAVAQQLLR